MTLLYRLRGGFEPALNPVAYPLVNANFDQSFLKPHHQDISATEGPESDMEPMDNNFHDSKSILSIASFNGLGIREGLLLKYIKMLFSFTGQFICILEFV